MHSIERIGFLLEHLREIETRKKMQKIVHILQVSGAPFPEEFRFHLYGPYSSDLRAELDAFEKEGLIREDSQGTSYILKPEEKLLNLIKESANRNQCTWLSLASRLNEKTPKDLEGISTVLYFKQRKWPQNTWAEKFFELKAHLADEFGRYQSEALKITESASA